MNNKNVVSSYEAQTKRLNSNPLIWSSKCQSNIRFNISRCMSVWLFFFENENNSKEEWMSSPRPQNVIIILFDEGNKYDESIQPVDHFGNTETEKTIVGRLKSKGIECADGFFFLSFENPIRWSNEWETKLSSRQKKLKKKTEISISIEIQHAYIGVLAIIIAAIATLIFGFCGRSHLSATRREIRISFASPTFFYRLFRQRNYHSIKIKPMHRRLIWFCCCVGSLSRDVLLCGIYPTIPILSISTLWVSLNPAARR